MSILFSGRVSAYDMEGYFIRQGIDSELAATLAELIANGTLSTEEEVNDWLKAYYENLGIVIETEFNAIDAVLEADRERQKAERKRLKAVELQKSAEAQGVDFDKITARD
jgi:BMFP domain-containing protein YqiC